MSNNCGTHLISVPNGQLCPMCFPSNKLQREHLLRIREEIEYALKAGISKKDILDLVEEAPWEESVYDLRIKEYIKG